MSTTTQTPGPTTISIDGMSCDHCVKAVDKALAAVPGVKVRAVNIGSAVIESPDTPTTDKAVAAIDEAGFAAKAVSAASPSPAPTSAGGCCAGSKPAAAADAPATKPGSCCG